MAEETKKPYSSLDAKPNADSLIKPGELVDLVEVTPLTLNDRRIYNLMLEHAWDEIDKPVVHHVSKATLRGTHNSNDRIGESVERLMRAIVKVSVLKDGEPAIERVQLLGGNIELEQPDGMLYYEIPRALRRIIKNSTVFARLQKEVMFALSSKYALTLYEMVQKRGNLRFKSSDKFTLEELRGILGVPKGKLTTWSNLQLRALKPAVEEVNVLSDYNVSITPYKEGRRVAGVVLAWTRKNAEGQSAVDRELEYSKVGRKARREGRVEAVVEVAQVAEVKPRPAWLARAGEALRTETYETAKLRFPGYDIYHVESEWRAWAQDKDAPKDPDKAFLAFFRKFAERNPI
ncbi:RepB family plasmid replication initiator protein [Epibacterium sp. SM1969]|uniref:RepB family plasmid replication initiator protein n=1 Tax=Tritonibacter aquimaris TaxID=2663379 RepID=A0A844AN42_9RHOB|nr:replication initiation protein [Tritonibacter aquimaris]MQY43865.1 RepB family plasmid replication initiator protein [Tritonibacter aquimaris]